ncbi:hypothetical protein CQ13_39615 [Bradyrhizobium retamae]|uniref:NAD(P)-binding domain-containing protein n=1 Tax=Bradyrhizobium retamae TaxID=1300035 RepID=A0A0R3N7G6_9BRAD|nr:hypothetical protein CQ13_39615 [Bradyrhizobium retamae]
MNGFRAGKRVFLTGHTGFKGSWLAFWLQHLGARVIGSALAPPPAPVYRWFGLLLMPGISAQPKPARWPGLPIV